MHESSVSRRKDSRQKKIGTDKKLLLPKCRLRSSLKLTKFSVPILITTESLVGFVGISVFTEVCDLSVF